MIVLRHGQLLVLTLCLELHVVHWVIPCRVGGSNSTGQGAGLLAGAAAAVDALTGTTHLKASNMPARTLPDLTCRIWG